VPLLLHVRNDLIKRASVGDRLEHESGYRYWTLVQYRRGHGRCHAHLSAKGGASAATIPGLRETLTLGRSSLPVLHILIQLSIGSPARVARSRLAACGSLLSNRRLRRALRIPTRSSSGALWLVGCLSGLSAGGCRRARLLIRLCTGS
jgi:hypothetical protein